MVELSDKQWERLRKYFPEGNIPLNEAGRKLVPKRNVFEGVLWIPDTGMLCEDAAPMLIEAKQKNLTGDRTWNSDGLDEELRASRIEIPPPPPPIALHSGWPS